MMVNRNENFSFWDTLKAATVFWLFIFIYKSSFRNNASVLRILSVILVYLSIRQSSQIAHGLDKHVLWDNPELLCSAWTTYSQLFGR